MITVSISINGNPILTRSATKIDGDVGLCKYKVDDGSILEHNYDDGAAVLAKKMLGTIVEMKIDG